MLSAVSLLFARQLLVQPLTGLRGYSSNASGPPAFVLDIDGVLRRGKETIPAALEAMQQVTSTGSAW